MRSKDADRMANSVGPNQTASGEKSDLSLHCLRRPKFPKRWSFTVDDVNTSYSDPVFERSIDIVKYP